MMLDILTVRGHFKVLFCTGAVKIPSPLLNWLSALPSISQASFVAVGRGPRQVRAWPRFSHSATCHFLFFGGCCGLMNAGFCVRWHPSLILLKVLVHGIAFPQVCQCSGQPHCGKVTLAWGRELKDSFLKARELVLRL